MHIINKLLTRLDLMLVRPSRLNKAIKQQTAEHMEQVDDLQQRLIAMSHENEKPRCDGPWLNEIEQLRQQLKKQKVAMQRLRCRITYYKNKSRKEVVA